MNKDKKNDDTTLGGRLKGYERDYEKEVEPEKHIMIRIDGHHFKDFTKGLKKPFDEILSRAMIETTRDLVHRFSAYTGYTQSDEISLFIPTLKDITVDDRKKPTHKLHKRVRPDWKHEFSGRVQKMCSLVAGYTTARFNYHINKLVKDEMGYGENASQEEWQYWDMILSKKLFTAYFDARMYGVDDTDEVFNSFLWRVRDAEKNSRSMFAQAYCSHKALQFKNGKEQVDYCKEQTGKDWETINPAYKYGTFIKKELYEKPVDKKDPSYKEDGSATTTRSRYTEFSRKLVYSEQIAEEITAQYYNPKG